MSVHKLEGIRMPGSWPSLLNLSAPVISFGLNLTRPGVLQAYRAENLREEFTRLIEGFKQQAFQNGHTHQAAEDATFALIASVDELINVTTREAEWDGGRDYLNNPLSLALFKTTNAGKEFFTRLSSIRKEPQKHQEVIEVYLACLAFGFQGEYDLKGESKEQERTILIESLRLEFKRGQQAPGELSEKAYPDPQENIPREVVRPWIVWAIAASVTLLVGIGLITSAQRSLNKSAREITTTVHIPGE